MQFSIKRLDSIAMRTTTVARRPDLIWVAQILAPKSIGQIDHKSGHINVQIIEIFPNLY
jgi:hypothetical protein